MRVAPSLPKIRDSLRRLFRVYAHIYHHHVSFFDDIGEMKLLQVRSECCACSQLCVCCVSLPCVCLTHLFVLGCSLHS
jgi:hypothetical protein